MLDLDSGRRGARARFDCETGGFEGADHGDGVVECHWIGETPKPRSLEHQRDPRVRCQFDGDGQAVRKGYRFADRVPRRKGACRRQPVSYRLSGKGHSGDRTAVLLRDPGVRGQPQYSQQ